VSALEFVRVSAGYPARPVLVDVTTTFAIGSVTGLIGPNGAGKTTLLRAALGFLKTTSGEVRVLGNPLPQWGRESLARAMAYLPQTADAHWPILARRLVSLGRMPHRAALAPLSAEDEVAIDEALARCDAAPFARRRMDELSAGERARVMLARALATRAPILLADEPAAHLDPAHQLQLMDLLRDESRRGAAVIVTLHDLALASRFCDRVVVLKSGQVVAQGAPDEALSDEALAASFGIAARRIGGDGASIAIMPWRRV
jgi:iron complex transport system ATP-binding protein